ncbi:MAG: endonuclease MutS2 [Halobacteriaceae archaeon]
MDIEAIEGVGEKTAAALAELDDPERALRDGDVAAIAEAPGVSVGRAARIARAAARHRHGGDGDFLATDRASEVYDALLDLLVERTVTDYAARRLEAVYPTAAESRIEEVRALSERAMGREPVPEARDALSGVEPLADPGEVTVRERCLATTDAERYAAAREAVAELAVELVEDARELGDLARGYSTVVALDAEFAGVEVEGDVRVEPDALDDPAALVPERTLAFFAANRDRVRAAVAVHERAGLDAPDGLDTGELSAALDCLADDGGVAGDEELDRLAAAAEGLEEAVAAAEHRADERLREAIRERDVTIAGTDLLSLIEQGAGVDSLLDRELETEYEAAVAAAREHVVEALSLTEDEAARIRAAFPDEPTYPVEADEAAVAALRDELAAERDRRSASRKRELAAELADLREPARALVRRALDLDVELAVARFARDFDATMPEFGGEGIAIEGGRSPLLDEPIEAVEPVDYRAEGVRLLSGVNSGGKTSLLDLVAAVVALAHAGLPVPAASVRLQRFEALYYHAKTQGTLDAGAFESTLREFADIAVADTETLVLVDELESITEPGASATIIAGLLEALSERAATAVFVSHLAGEILEETAADVGVDGIEALGLEDGELRVNRSPVRGHLARSTPELIVEKLAAEGNAFYDRLMDKFEK